MFENRWLITGTLTTLSPLHIGTGEPLTNRIPADKGQDTPSLVSGVTVDFEGKPYIPGRTLKNNLRSWLEQTNVDAKHVEQLFGSSGILSLDVRRATGQEHWGGKLEFLDAFLTSAETRDTEAETDAKPPHWDPARHTAVAARTAIDRRTRTVREKKLFHEEYVPPGCSFRVSIAGEGLTDDEVAVLLQVLEGFNHPGVPARLGAGRSDGWGRVQWTLDTVRCLDATGIKNWLENPDDAVGYGIVETFGTKIGAKDFLQQHPPLVLDVPPRLVLEIELAFQGPFVVNDPARAGGDNVGDIAPLVDEGGRPVLPASSLRGALRSQAERIVRTIGSRACHVDDPDDACPAVEEIGTVKDLCATCRLFGAPGWGTPIELSDFGELEDSKAIRFRHEMVAIDRFTGGAADHLKFNADVFWQPVLRGTVSVELGRIDKAGLAVLALTLRDLFEGDIPLGYGASKGYGALRGRIVSAALIGGGEDTSVDGTGTASLVKATLADNEHEALSSLAESAASMVTQLLTMRKIPVDDRATAATVAPDAAPQPNHAPAGTGNDFHNPYHFVPVQAIDQSDALQAGNLGTDYANHVTHDRYVDGTFSGRILCRLVTEEPVAIGSKRSDPGNNNEPAQITPFTIDGEPAIPGTSLRGMIASLAEAASNSALRVLEDRSFSYRQRPPRGALPSIGILVRAADDFGNEELRLRPLTLPPCRWDNIRKCGHMRPWNIAYQDCNLKVYVNEYIPHNGFQKRGFLNERDPDSASSANSSGFWYLRLNSVSVNRNGDVSTARPYLKNGWVIGQRPVNGADPIPEAEWRTLRPTEKTQYTRGILRVLGVGGRENDLPRTKKHEIFIPYPTSMENTRTLEAHEAIERFHRLADERAWAARAASGGKRLPFELKGMSRAHVSHGKETVSSIRLREGDLVFFRPDNNGTRADEVAVSCIWRADAGTCHPYFAAIDPELLPFNPDREKITLAEQLFGFVENIPEGTKKPARALAGRVRFSFGLLTDETKQEPGERWQTASFLGPVTLKILSTPKPPSPALYFTKQSDPNAHIAKSDLEPGVTLPQGRKMYLHQHHGENRAPWETTNGDHNNQKARVKPLRPGLAFDFSIDFDNLSERELGLLCYALRPTEAFRHKLGMGKPLGLGRVRIEPLAIQYVDRKSRYSGGAQVDPDGEASRPSFDAVRNTWRAGMEENIRTAIETIGDPESVTYPVHYPVCVDAPLEGRHYEWFVANDGGSNQQLKPVTGSPLPTLSKLPNHHGGRGAGRGGRGRGGNHGGRRHR